MSNPRFRFVARVLLITAVFMALLGAYFLLVADNFVIGVALLAVAMGDAAAAIVFSRRAG
jgi:dolichol kinase